MVVATASPDGTSPVDVLCKGLDEAGIVFYTNLTSDKSRDLQANPRAAATFPWIALQRQVHFRGPVVRVSDETAQAYWATRPRGSRLGAWASPQSTVLPDRAALDALRDKAYEQFGESDDAGDASRCRRSGAAGGSSRKPSSSGRAGSAGCTTGCATGPTDPIGHGGPELGRGTARTMTGR